MANQKLENRKTDEEVNEFTSFRNYPEHAVAVIGMACRTAAGDTMDDFWQVIQDGRSMARELDAKRFPDAPEGLRGYFLSEIDSFDHQFFKKSKHESSTLDPHQRVLLQTTYHALESTGCFGGRNQQIPESFDKSKNQDTTGCFIGMNAPDYPLNLACHQPSPYSTLGMLRSFPVSGRLSHFFGWTGPSQVIDTACSSSMGAIHQACRALEAGECTQAVAGGINLITNNEISEALRAGGSTSQTGTCKTFDALAYGYCRSEAVGVVVLKSLTKALNDGDIIEGVILTTANNQKFDHTRITNSVLESQVALYDEVLARAKISPKDISYVEAHGTGTSSGDPVEVSAIRQALGGIERHQLLHIGSANSNIGRAEATSEVVSLIKVLLMMKHGKIPPQAQYQSLNLKIDSLERDRLAVSKSLQDWENEWRLALVTNAGASENNAFAVVAPAPEPPQKHGLSPTPHPAIKYWPIFISASSKVSLLTYCKTLERQICNGQLSAELGPHVAYTLATKQNRQLENKCCFTASSFDDLRTQLSKPEKHTTSSLKPNPIVLLFSCQDGDTIPGARSIYYGSMLFRKHLHHCDEVMKSLELPSLLSAALQGIEGNVNLVVRHAAKVAIQYSCGMAWIDSGVIPGVICGHSLGEWTALAVSGAISLETCMTIVTGNARFAGLTVKNNDLRLGRASLIQKLWGVDKGAMISVETDLVGTNKTPVNHLQSFWGDRPDLNLDIACFNGPTSYVVAGSTSDIEILELYMQRKKRDDRKIRYHVLKGIHAYHSILVDSILDRSADLCDSVDFKEKTKFPFELCHKGPSNKKCGHLTAWNTRGPVYFSQAISRIVKRLGPCTFLEAGIGGPIISMARNALSQSRLPHEFIAISAKDPLRSLADATVSLWKSGNSGLQFWLFHREEQKSYIPVALPLYEFETHKHWFEYTELSNSTVQDQQQPCSRYLKNTSDAPYLSQKISAVNVSNQVVFSIDTHSRRYQDLVSGHTVLGFPICPAVVYLELASHAITLLPDAADVTSPSSIFSERLEIRSPLGLDSKRQVELSLVKQTQNVWSFELSSQIATSKSTVHVTGVICLRQWHTQNDSGNPGGTAKWNRVCNLLDKDDDTESLRGTMVYKVMRKRVIYSSPYKGLKYLVSKGSEGGGDIKMPTQDLDATATTSHAEIANPVLMENFLQVADACVNSLRGTEDEDYDDMTYVCTSMGAIGPLNGLQTSEQYRVYTKVQQEDNEHALLNIFAFSKETKKMIWSAKDLRFAKTPRKSLSKMLAAASPECNVKEYLIFEPPVPEYLHETTSIGATLNNKFTPIDKPDQQTHLIQLSNHVQADWQDTILKTLSLSLNINATDIEIDSTLRDLGTDSLLVADIVSNINQIFGLRTSPSDLAPLVASLCNLIATVMGIAPVNRRPSDSSNNSISTTDSIMSTSVTTCQNISSSTSDGNITCIQADSLWESFRRTRYRFDDHARENRLTGFWEDVYPQQLRAVAAFIVEAFEKLGCPIGRTRPGEILPLLQTTQPRRHQLVSRLWEILDEAGIVQKRGGIFVRGPVHLEHTGDHLSEQLILGFPQYASSHRLFCLTGPHLAEFLTGKLDPTSLLFDNENNRKILMDYYSNAPDLFTATKVLCDFLSVVIQAQNGETFHVLEIGAGTGGTTRHLLPVLQASGLPFTYTFSDISVSLLAHAKSTTFKGIAGMEFRQLNVEDDPTAELLGRYHVIVSSNCVHATHNLQDSLRNIRKMIKPGGCVALIEATQKIAWYDLVWGLLDGWWLFNDDRTYALQSPWGWERAMHNAGFPHVDWSESPSRESRDVRVICGMDW